MDRDLVIVGGGLIGVTTALLARHAGLSVTLVERGAIGDGAARGNAGWISPTKADPLPSPEAARELLHAWRPTSPLWLRPPASLDFLRFGAGFLRHCTPAAYAAAHRAHGAIGALTEGAIADLAAAGLPDPRRGRGIFVAYADPAAAAAYHRDLSEHVARFGFAPLGPLLDADGLHAERPDLGPALRAGFLVPGDRHVDPGAYVDAAWARAQELGVEGLLGGSDVALVAAAAARPAGGEGPAASAGATSGAARLGWSAWRARVRGRARTRAPIVGVRVDGDVLTARHVLVAAGAWTDDVLRTAGLRLPLQPGKGYSFSVAVAHQPDSSVLLPEPHVAVTPHGGGLRIAGTMELSGDRTTLRAGRIDAMIRAVRPFLPEADWSRPHATWCGPRPLLPDGLPAIGPTAAAPGLLLATGHGMNGLTLAPATARVVVDLLLGERPRIDLAPFAPDRLLRPD